MECKFCGAALNNGEAFCPYCGRTLEYNDAASAQPFCQPDGIAPETDDPQNYHQSLSFQDSGSQFNGNSGVSKFFFFIIGITVPLFISPILYFVFNRGKTKPCAKFVLIGFFIQTCILLLFLGAAFLSGDFQ